MKRIVSLLLAALLLVGCGNSTVNEETEDNQLLNDPSPAAVVAITSPHYTVTRGMLTYFFHNVYGQYYDYTYYYGIDTTVSLKEQTSPYFEGSWFDYFMDETRAYVSDLLALCELAWQDGITLSTEENANIEGEINKLKEEAAAYEGDTFDEVLTNTYGSEVREADLRAALELTALGQKYAAWYGPNLHLTEADYEACYEANRDYFDCIDVLTFTIKASDFGYKENTEGGMTLEEARASIYYWVERFQAAESDDDFRAVIRDYAVSVQGKNEVEVDNAVRYAMVTGAYSTDPLIGSEVAEWAFFAEVGECEVYADSKGTVFDVFRLVTPMYRFENLTRNVRHILFDFEMYSTEEAAKAAAEEVYAAWEKGGFTEQLFIELCAEYSDDADTAAWGGLYADLAEDYMVREFDEWTFDAARVPGDHALIGTAYGWHIMSYVGESELTTWQAEAREIIVEDRYNALLDAYGALNQFDEAVINGIEA